MSAYFFNINIAIYKYSNNNNILEKNHNYINKDDSNITLMILINEKLNHYHLEIPNAEINQYNYNINKDLSIKDNLNNNKIKNIEKDHILHINLFLGKENIELHKDELPCNIKNIKGFDADNSIHLYNNDYNISNISSKENNNKDI